MNRNLIIYIIGGLLLLSLTVGYFLVHHAPLAPNSIAAFDEKLASCNAYLNGSTQNVTETSRLTIYLPKDYFPNQQSLLKFQTISGTAVANWVSNAGSIGNSYGASADCFAYYYEFTGSGTVDLIATSSVVGIPTYTVYFVIGTSPTSQTIKYRNDAYRFTFDLPPNWKGYSIVEQKWHGSTSGTNTAHQGPEILIRNPLWKINKPYQDIPIMVFTTDEWTAIQNGTLVVSAAPIPPTELGHSASYVFALPARYNYAFPAGYKEVETILQGNPLRPF